MEFIAIIDIIYLYYIVVSNVVRFEIKVVFVVKMFFIVFFVVLRLTLIIVNSLYSFSNAKCIYIFTLKFFNSSVFKSSSNSISNMFKGINIKTFLKLIDNNIRSVIIILYSIFIMLTLF